MRKNIILGGASLLFVACAAMPASAANLLANPGFESAVTYDGPPFIGSWEAFNGGAGSSAANSAVTPRSGAQDLELSINATDNTFAGAFQDVGGLVPGQIATFSGFHQTTSAVLGVASEYRIEWRNSGNLGTEISRVQLTNSPVLNQYTSFSVTGPVPAGADTARLVYAIQTFGGEPAAGNTGIVHVDDVSFVVPEPTSIAALGAAGLLLGRKRR